jgi:predicted transcriptional regulator
MMREEGIEIELQIYNDGIEVVRDLSILRLDLGIAPILSSFMCTSLGAPFKILAAAGSGGSSVICRKKMFSSEKPVVATTRLSTMEMLTRASMSKGILPQDSKMNYVSSADAMLSGLRNGSFDAVCIWEPYATLLSRRRGHSRLARYNDIGEHVCCVLAAGNHLEEKTLRKVFTRFREATNSFAKTPEPYVSQYSSFVGFSHKISGDVCSEYTHPFELNCDLISKQFQVAGIGTPDPSTLGEFMIHF